MKQLTIEPHIQNRNFNANIYRGSDSFKVSLTKTGSVVKATSFSDSKTLDVKTNLNNSSAQMSAAMDTTGGDIDEYYDEIIYYDGGGVEGYGY